MSSIEASEMEKKVQEFLGKARPGQLFNYSAADLPDGTRALTIYETQNTDWAVPCPGCGHRQYEAPKCRLCGVDITARR